MVFLHYLLRYEFFPIQKVIANLCVYVWLECVCVCVHLLKKDFCQAIIGTFYQCHFQKMVGWVAFKFSFLFMLKFKSFKCDIKCLLCM